MDGGGWGGGKFFPPWAHEHEVEDWGHEQAKESDADHPGEDGGAHGAAHFRAGSGAGDQRVDAGDEGDGSHQDRTQAESGGRQRRLGRSHAFILFLANKFHDQNRIFTGEADQHDQADLSENIIIAVDQAHADERAEQAHGNDEDDGQR